MEQNLIKTFLDQEIEIYGDELALEKNWAAAKATAPVVQGTAGEPSAALDVSHVADLQALQQTIADCRQCGLSSHRQNLIFGTGHEHPDIVLVGEHPSTDEDAAGAVMTGPAGVLLDKILASIQLTREQVYLCHLVKCSPPANRELKMEEISTCRSYLEKQLSLLQPKFILCLGRLAASVLLDKKANLSQLRGKAHRAFGCQVIATYSPVTLLRYPQFKRDVWEDVKLLRRLYDEYLAQQE